jgi:small-conductance mechanosensitive channel
MDTTTTFLTYVLPFGKSLLLFVLIYPIIRYLAGLAKNFFNLKIGPHQGTLVGSIVYYTGLLMLVATMLNTIGINVSAFLGAAGVLGIAIGFAAQTSISNVISGIFLLLERPFSIGDEIECDSISGTVEAIDPLSVKLRTKNNEFVRIPNEVLIKRSFINHSFYPVRRIQITVKVRDGHLDEICQQLTQLANEQSGVLHEPKVQVFIASVNSLSTIITVRCWSTCDDSTTVRRELITAFVKKLAPLYPKVSIG